jgi:hypothetical protein
MFRLHSLASLAPFRRVDGAAFGGTQRLRDGKAVLRRICGGYPPTPSGCAVANVAWLLDGIGD